MFLDYLLMTLISSSSYMGFRSHVFRAHHTYVDQTCQNFDQTGQTLAGPVRFCCPTDNCLVALAKICTGPVKHFIGPVNFLTGPVKILTGLVSILTGPVKFLTRPVKLLTGPVKIFWLTGQNVCWTGQKCSLIYTITFYTEYLTHPTPKNRKK